MKEKKLFGRIFLIQTKGLFKLNKIYLIETKYPWQKYIFLYIK